VRSGSKSGERTARSARKTGAQNLRRDEARHPSRLGQPEPRHVADDGGAAPVAAEQRAVRPLRRGRDAVARECDPAGPGDANGQLLHEWMQVAAVRDQADRHALVQQQRQDGSGRASAGWFRRVPEVRGEPRARVERRPRRQVVRQRVAERRHDPRGDQALDGDERERELRSQRDEAHEAARRPFVDSAEIDRGQLLDGDGARRLRAQEGPFQVQSQAEGIVDLLHAPRGEQVARDAGRGQARRVVDLQVDEAGEDERLLRPTVPPLDRGDDAVLDDELPGEAALDRVNEKSL